MDGEVALLGRGAVEALFQPLPQLAVLDTQAAVVLQELFAGGAGEAGVGDGALDLVGVVVDGLAAAAAAGGLGGDVAVAAAQGGGGVADPGTEG